MQCHFVGFRVPWALKFICLCVFLSFLGKNILNWPWGFLANARPNILSSLNLFAAGPKPGVTGRRVRPSIVRSFLYLTSSVLSSGDRNWLVEFFHRAIGRLFCSNGVKCFLIYFGIRILFLSPKIFFLRPLLWSFAPFLKPTLELWHHYKLFLQISLSTISSAKIYTVILSWLRQNRR